MKALKTIGIIAGIGGAGYLLVQNVSALSDIKEQLQLGGGSGGGSFMDFSFFGDMISGVSDVFSGAFLGLTDTAKTLSENSGRIITSIYEKSFDKIPTTEDFTDWLKTIVGVIPDFEPLEKIPSVDEVVDNVITKAKQTIQKSIPFDLKKTALTVGAGWGFVGLLSGTAPPLIPFLAVTLADIWGFLKLRGITIEKTGKTPEQNVGDFVKNTVENVKSTITGSTKKSSGSGSSSQKTSSGSSVNKSYTTKKLTSNIDVVVVGGKITGVHDKEAGVSRKLKVSDLQKAVKYQSPFS